MQEKRQRLNGLARCHQCSVKTHDKPAFVLHLASTTARIQAGARELCRLPSCPTRFASYFLTIKKVNQRSKGTEFLLRICGRKGAILKQKQKQNTSLTKQHTNYYPFSRICLDGEHGVPCEPCFVRRRQTLPSAAQYRKTFCLYRINMWHDSVCCNEFL